MLVLDTKKVILKHIKAMREKSLLTLLNIFRVFLNNGCSGLLEVPEINFSSSVTFFVAFPYLF